MPRLAGLSQDVYRESTETIREKKMYWIERMINIAETINNIDLSVKLTIC